MGMASYHCCSDCERGVTVKVWGWGLGTSERRRVGALCEQRNEWAGSRSCYDPAVAVDLTVSSFAVGCLVSRYMEANKTIGYEYAMPRWTRSASVSRPLQRRRETRRGHEMSNNLAVIGAKRPSPSWVANQSRLKLISVRDNRHMTIRSDRLDTS